MFNLCFGRINFTVLAWLPRNNFLYMGLGVGKLVVGLLAIWLVVIVMLSGPLFHASEPDEQLLSRLTRAVGELDAIKQQNEELHAILNSLRSSSALDMVIKDKLMVVPLSKKDADDKTLVCSASWEPSLKFEETRRRAATGVVEMWYYLTSQLKKVRKTGNKEVVASVAQLMEDMDDHKRTILIDMENLQDFDGLDEWRKKEAEELSQIVQNRLSFLQNPKDCSSARKLVCSLNKGCGFGCQLHHIVYCLIMAYGTQRTLILHSKNWRYARGGWETIFESLSETCTDDAGSSRVSWPGSEDTQVIDLPIVDNVKPSPPYLPLAIPKDLSERLIRLHGNPAAWWIGQFVKYLMRPQKELADFLKKAESLLNIRGTVVGIHVRRTDKIGTEASFHGIEEYMVFVEDFYKTLELKEKKIDRQVYLATDDPELLKECKRKYPNYKFFGDPKIAQTAAITSRYSSDSLRGVIFDIHMLSKCDKLVCTFSSQVCRVAYEIMQTLHPDASNYFHSLDDIFYFGGQKDHNQMVLYDHKPRSEDEIELHQGDTVGIAGNHWDGYSKGLNRRTHQVGLYPSYKAVEKIDVVDFPTYEEMPQGKK